MKNIKTILFDLDGTLLPMDIEKFKSIYFYEIGKYFEGTFDSRSLMKNIWESTKVMVSNTELRTNEDVFWEDFLNRLGDVSENIKDHFMEYYETGFQKVKAATTKSEDMINSVKLLKKQGYEVVIATNPVFPRKAIYDRIRWAGFEPEEFKYITTFENNHYCKPQLEYYKEILEILKCNPKDCMMVGNNEQEDIIASKLGIKTWLITDCLIDIGEDKSLSDYSGSAKDFYGFIERLTE